MIINDLSLHGQFDEDEFYDVIVNTFKPIMDKLDAKGIELLKSQELYNRKVTGEKTLQQLIGMAGNPVMSRLKSLLINLAYSEPFIEDNDGPGVLVDDVGESFTQAVCLFEAIQRNDSLLSFPKSEFSLSTKLKCNYDECEYTLDNVNTKNDLMLWLLSKKHNADFVESFSEWQYASKQLQFDGTNAFEKDMKQLEASQSFQEKDYKRILVHLEDLEKVILTRNVTRFSHPLIPERHVYEYRLSLSNSNEIRMTYLMDSTIVFLTAFIKKTEQTSQNERRRAISQL
ncbi:type II toxin-antitoxin system RelE/ParE family toxin [Butyrivibrio fibrisolvens]|uniref:type II toxin-antitoxin system RelE/ParE family toxin n=1 Tax=Butyrivibrio fibrisolvens TaxID=831 RepID=UPI00040FA0AD|nr:type II toxin-antitoxin system RelE/ParE family toxin [Butyrivibrio fibrisolvens]